MRYIQYWLRRSPGGMGSHDLEAFIAQGTKAGQNLHYCPPDELAGEVALQASALANSEGGLLLVGVEVDEERDERGEVVALRPRGIQGTPFHEREKEMLSGIQPPLEGVEVARVRAPDGGVVILLDVPPSPAGAHRAPDGHFYIRRGFRSVPLREDEVEAIRTRRARPRLVPLVEVVRVEPEAGRATLRISLENQGRTAAGGVRVSLRLLGAGEAGEGTPSEYSWEVPNAVAPEGSLHLGNVTLTYRGDLAAEVAVSAPHRPPDLYHYLATQGLQREVRALVEDQGAWVLPLADQRQVQEWWTRGRTVRSGA